MLHNEARKLLVQAYEQTRDAQSAAKCFQVSTSAVYRLSMQLKIRLLSLLPRGIAEAFPRIRPSDCAGWFSAAGIPC